MFVGKVDKLTIDTFDFKPDLKTDFENADLIITHCGAGTILEILRIKKRAVGVINSKLLDNHQFELAEAMRLGTYMAIADSPEEIARVITSTAWESIKAFPDPKPDVFLAELKSLIKLD